MEKPKLYVKAGCPWCIDALDYFRKKAIELEVIDVRAEPSRMSELLEVSGQTMTPTLKHDEFLVADFDLDELETTLMENSEAKKALGL